MNGHGSAILVPDVRLSAEQREQQRQQILHDLGVLARNLNLLREGVEQIAVSVESLGRRIVALETPARCDTCGRRAFPDEPIGRTCGAQMPPTFAQIIRHRCNGTLQPAQEN